MKKPLPLHPFLFALYPVLFTFAHNVEEVSFTEIVLPAAIVLGCSIALWLLCALVYRDWLKAGVVVSIFLLLFFSHGHIVVALRGAGVMVGARHLLPVWALLFLGSAYAVKRTPGPLIAVTKVANIVAALLVGMSVVRISVSQLNAARAARPAESDAWLDASAGKALEGEQLPDIYYIILDRYPRADTLKEVYDCDTTEFIEYLSSKGFYVASRSRCNYHQTWLSLASSLNMEHLHRLAEKNPATGIIRSEVYPRLQNHRAWRFLKRRGYKYIHFGSWWQPTMRNNFADVNVNGYALPELLQAIYDRTALCPILAYSGIYEKRLNHWKAVLYGFDKLAHVPSMDGHKFVFAHILVPHRPFVFDADGSFVPKDEADKRPTRENIKRQVLFLNSKLRNLIEKLLAGSAVPPVIILQADEGPFPPGMVEDYRRASPEQLRERMCILNAYHVPGLPKDTLYPSVTPVNSLRLVFNHYFGAGFELLPDESYVTVNDGGRRFLKVTRMVTGAKGEGGGTGMNRGGSEAEPGAPVGRRCPLEPWLKPALLSRLEAAVNRSWPLPTGQAHQVEGAKP